MVSFPGAKFVSGSSKLVASGSAPTKSAPASSAKVVVKSGVKVCTLPDSLLIPTLHTFSLSHPVSRTALPCICKLPAGPSR